VDFKEIMDVVSRGLEIDGMALRRAGA